MNNGTCHDTIGSYVCTCPEYYIGTHCQIGKSVHGLICLPTILKLVFICFCCVLLNVLWKGFTWTSHKSNVTLCKSKIRMY